MSLTDVMCKKAQPQEKQYRLSDTNGLSLRIDPNGKKYWSIRYTENGQRKSKALGMNRTGFVGDSLFKLGYLT